MRAIMGLPDYGIPRWLDSVERACNRLSFTVADDLELAVQMIRRETAPLGSISANDRIVDLIKFGVSQNYFDLRDQLALTIQN